MTYKDYDAMLVEQVGGRPSFKVANQVFTCRAKLPWKKFRALLLSLTASNSVGDEALKETEDFFRMVLVAQDRQRFIDLLNYEGNDEDENDDAVIDSKQVGPILDDLLAHYTGKATANDSDSSDSPQSAGQPSNVTSLTPREAAN